ncbi:hypothetical protein F0562_015240 [Nyssa sinensis]|uniref:Uncharacterized protein n=1 Tax=Nyssa sinensis TaxID=561372 RepID=A0A5J4ZGQ6_9ASTE|nr:hypothetical protein F0562_015240 [Nyssa sinensis]
MLADESSSKSTRFEERACPIEAVLTLGELENLDLQITGVVGTSNPPMTNRGKEIAMAALGELGSPMSSINDAFRINWDFSWSKILGELIQVCVTQAIHAGYLS